MLRRETSSNNNNNNRREAVGRLNPRQISISDLPPVQMVTVAVLPPRLPPGPFNPRTGVPMAHIFNWDEALNWTPSSADIERQKQKQRSKNPFKRSLTTARQKANPDLPPCVMKQVPYETWRKHYAKDKEGNYKGTHAPAEDCLLRPHDVEKWSFKGERGKGTESDAWVSRFTRGKEALPVYNEVKDEGMVPGYEVDYDRDVHSDAINGNAEARKGRDGPPEEPILEEDEEANEELQQLRQQEQRVPPSLPPPTPLEQMQARDPNSGLPYDAQREREELLARNKRSERWKTKLQRGLEMASMGN